MDKEKILDRTKKDLRSVLISAPRGVPLPMLLRDFKQVLGSELPFKQLGFQRVEDFLKTIPDVVKVGRGVTGDPTCFAVADACTSQIARFVAAQKKPKLKKSNAPPCIRKPTVYTGFTKKGKFGPKAPKKSQYYQRNSGYFRSGSGGYGGGGSKFPGTGNVYTGGPPQPRQGNKPGGGAYGKGELREGRVVVV